MNWLDFSNTKIDTNRSLSDYSKVQQVVSEIIRNKKIFIRSGVKEEEYLDVGCGTNTHDNFINLDYEWVPGIDICWDVTKGIPLQSESVRGIFTEHCLEHIKFESLDYVISEFYRVLRPRGVLRIVVPDGELYLKRYNKMIKNGEENMPYQEEDRYEGMYSPIWSVNRIFRGHGHKFIHDYDSLKRLLDKNGFDEIEKKSFNSGKDETLLIDTESRSIESLYVEGLKF